MDKKIAKYDKMHIYREYIRDYCYAVFTCGKANNFEPNHNKEKKKNTITFIYALQAFRILFLPKQLPIKLILLISTPND